MGDLTPTQLLACLDYFQAVNGVSGG